MGLFWCFFLFLGGFGGLVYVVDRMGSLIAAACLRDWSHPKNLWQALTYTSRKARSQCWKLCFISINCPFRIMKVRPVGGNLCLNSQGWGKKCFVLFCSVSNRPKPEEKHSGKEHVGVRQENPRKTLGNLHKP